MLLRFCAALFLVLNLSACAPAPLSVHGTDYSRLPTNAEVETYVRDYWGSFEHRFRFFAHQQDLTLKLLDVRDVRCGCELGVALCSFEAVVQTESGTTVSHRISGFFDYFDGVLRETVVT